MSNYSFKRKIKTWQPPPSREDMTKNAPISSGDTKAHTNTVHTIHLHRGCFFSFSCHVLSLKTFLFCFCMQHWKCVLWVTETLPENPLLWSTGGKWPSNRNIHQINTFIGTHKYQCFQFFWTSLHYFISLQRYFCPRQPLNSDSEPGKHKGKVSLVGFPLWHRSSQLGWLASAQVSLLIQNHQTKQLKLNEHVGLFGVPSSALVVSPIQMTDPPPPLSSAKDITQALWQILQPLLFCLEPISNVFYEATWSLIRMLNVSCWVKDHIFYKKAQYGKRVLKRQS